MKKTVGEILKYYLHTEQLTQAQFAHKIFATQGQVSEWISGKAKPGYDTLRQMAIAFDVPVEYWLGLVDNY